MKKQFISYEYALKLKELGFNEECLAIWKNETEELFMNDTTELSISDIPNLFMLAPLWQQAFEFFANEYDYWINIYKSDDSFTYTIETADDFVDIKIGFNTYEEARDKCIEKILQFIFETK